MNRLDINKQIIDRLRNSGVALFTLKRGTTNPSPVWTTLPKYYPKEMTVDQRVENFSKRIHKLGIDEIAMPDQPKDSDPCCELTLDQIKESYETDVAKRQGSLWYVDKPYGSLYIARDVYNAVKDELGRRVILGYPAADCAVIRFYDPKNDIMGVTHSDTVRTSRNIINQNVNFMRDSFGSQLDDIIAVVGAYAPTGMIWDKYPPFAEATPEVWDGHIKDLGDGRYEVLYGDVISEQLESSGLNPGNICMPEQDEHTIFNHTYFSNNRTRNNGDPDGRNLFLIGFDQSVLQNKHAAKAERQKRLILK